MKQTFARRSIPPLVSAAAALLVAAVPAVADNAKIKKASFTALLGITEALGPPISCTAAQAATGQAVTGTINGSGLSSFGPVTLTSQDCIVFNTPTSTTFKSVDAVLWTTSGEQINVAYCGTGTMAQPTGPLVLSGRYQFTGGSGPFKKASGCGNLYGIEDLSPLGYGQPARGFVALSEGTCSATGPECP